jgi:plasmid stabilization system protein ParE
MSLKPRSLVRNACSRTRRTIVDEILTATRLAQENPELFRIVRREGNIRRVLTKRFPYRIFFSVLGETLYVHAVLHGARHDRRWTERL